MRDENETQSDGQTRSGPTGAHLAMMACCTLMLLPVVGYFFAGGTMDTVGENLNAFAPLVLCVGAHFVMHKLMGKNCHTSEKAAKYEEIEQPVQDMTSTVPSVNRG